MAELHHLERFVAAYCKWPAGREVRRYLSFLKQFQTNVSDAVAYLGRVGNDVERAEARSVIYRLRNEWAWNVDVADFSITVSWRAGDDLLALPWSTLCKLLEVLHVANAKLGSTAAVRELYALLLSQILPIYFVKAANISPMLELLEVLLPNFVLRASGEQRDGSPSKSAPLKWDYRYDSCRGFEPRVVKGRQCLALIYNPEADLVPPGELGKQETTLQQHDVPSLPPLRPVVNFIWYGTGDPDRQNVGFANAIAEQLPFVIVRYWCLDEKRRVFESSLAPSTRLRSIERLLDEVDASWGAEFGSKVRAILTFYKTTKIFAPAKDLVSFLMLALHGGYFFDANCTISSISDFRVFGEALMTFRPLPAFLAMKSMLSYSEIDPQTYAFEEFQALTSPYALCISREDARLHDFPQTDMWTLYAPPGGASTFDVVVQQYVKRAVRAGLLTPAEARTPGQGDFVNSLSGSVGKDKGERDFNKRATAGALAIQSIFAGIHSLGSAYNPSEHGFPCENTGPESYRVACLGLAKTHGGSW